MLKRLTIDKSRERETSLDYKQLYALGIERIQELAAKIWNDYNIHDPGINTLELLCYALTDLSYRSNLPIADLLADKQGEIKTEYSPFFSAREILPGRPLTVLDYRKLLVNIEGVKNAWLRPAPLRYYADKHLAMLLFADNGHPQTEVVNIKGLYQVLVDFDDHLSARQKDRVKESITKTLQANRNLCEDFIALDEVPGEHFNLCSEIEIASDAEVNKVQAEIFFRLQHYLTPAIKFWTLSEMLEKTHKDGLSYSMDEIFNGPALEHGFIIDEELQQADLRQQIRLSDVINLIMDIDGVISIRDIVINPVSQTAPLANKWIVPITPGHKALLSVESSRLVCYKKNLPIMADNSQVMEIYQALSQQNRMATITHPEDLPVPTGRYRDTARYYAFQNHFPAVYGMGEAGLPAQADESRKIEVLQFKGYLLFFEQLLANYFQQLSQVRHLFSIDARIKQTYFYQTVQSFTDWKKIYATADPVKTQQEDIDSVAVNVERRNRFLDHLIARFAEQFSDFAYIMFSAFSTRQEALIQYKCDFLKDYPLLSSDRGLAYNASLKKPEAIWNSDNISGLERRLGRLLGISNTRRRNLGDIAYDIYAEIDATPDDEFRFRVRHKETDKILLSSSHHYMTPAHARSEMRKAIASASVESGYQRKMTTDGRHYFNIIDGDGEVIARRIQYFEHEDMMENAITETIHYLRTHYSDEGLYLIENILLRPELASDPFLPICVDQNCQDCSDMDPYSYRLHIVLPAYGARFAKQDFRRFAEQVIRAEIPAHILAKICWIDKEDMAVFEKAYHDWLDIKHGRTRAERQQKIKAFINALYTVRNIYTTERIGDCGNEQASRPFVLDNTSIGSFENSIPSTHPDQPDE
jgi:hypothetical protein